MRWECVKVLGMKRKRGQGVKDRVDGEGGAHDNERGAWNELTGRD